MFVFVLEWIKVNHNYQIMKSIVSDDRRFREKRGQGEGKDYVPWIQVTDFSSLGLKWRIPGVLIDRLHHFLSLLEE